MASGINSTECPANAKIFATWISCGHGFASAGITTLPFCLVIFSIITDITHYGGINRTPILTIYHNDKRADENGLATPAPRAHFRLYSELRSAIKSALTRDDFSKSSEMVRATGLEPAQPNSRPLPPQGSVSTNSTTRAWDSYNYTTFRAI